MANNPYNDNFASGGYFYNPIKRDLTIVKGDTLSFAFQIQGLQGTRPDSIYFTCKETVEADTPLFNISDGDAIRLRSYDETNDLLTYVVRIAPYLTASIELGRYFYDLELSVNGDIFTLLKGRFILDYAITDGDPLPPTYENGDNIRYPAETEVGVIKLYTEEYISDIGQAIHDINGLAQTYNTEEMSGALEDIKDDIDAIRAALASSIGADPDIPLSDIPSIVGSGEIINRWTFIKNWLKRYSESETNYGGLAYYLNNSTYGMIVAYDGIPLDLSLKITFPRTYDDHARGIYAYSLGIQKYNYESPSPSRQTGILSSLVEEVLPDFYPFFPSDFTWGNSEALLPNGDASELAIFNDPVSYIQAACLSEHIHPLLLELLNNERLCPVSEIRDKLSSIKWSDVIDSSFEGIDKDLITDFVVVNLNSASQSNMYLQAKAIYGSNTDHFIGTYNTETKYFSGVRGYHNEFSAPTENLFNPLVLPSSWTRWGDPQTGQGTFNTLDELANRVVLNTAPILDQNGNVILAANCTIEDILGG